MKRYLFLAFVFISGLLLAGCDKQTGDSVSSGGGKQLTAREAYKIALPEAKKFSSDSYLVNLSTVGVSDNGQSRTWFAIFYAPNKNTNYKVNVEEGKITGISDADKKKKNQVADNWIDSDKIAKTAIPRCGDVTENEYFFDLDSDNSDKTDKTAVWSVKCTVGENKTLTIDMNALNGEYIKTRKAGIGW